MEHKAKQSKGVPSTGRWADSRRSTDWRSQDHRLLSSEMEVVGPGKLEYVSSTFKAMCHRQILHVGRG
jgi:hypothetical protein